MNNISDKIIEITDGGKAIMVRLYPGLSEYINNGKMFRSPYREDTTPSAHFWKSPDGVYYLKDFGGDTLNPFDAYMRQHGCDFKQAIRELCDECGIDENGMRTRDAYPHSDFSIREAIPNATEGKYTETKDFTSAELRFLCPLPEDDVRGACQKYGMSSLKRLYIIKDGKEMSYQSNNGYPMFARTAKMIDKDGNVIKTVHKIYQPRYYTHNGKNFKFSYQETGLNPDSVINGLYELMQAVEDGDKTPIVVICCGERDAMCVAAAGAYPIWFNSECHRITSYEMKLIRKYAGQIYYIPDIDPPGWEAALRNMKAFPELRVVVLPEDLRQKNGDQHKACKDFRDWVELNPTPDAFWKLLNTSHTYKITRPTKKNCYFSKDDLVFFLKINGFRKYFDPYTKKYQLAHISGYQVENVTGEQICNFIQNSISDYKPYERDVVLKAISKKDGIMVEEIKVNFASATATSQVLYFNNMPVVITADGIRPTDASQTTYVMKSKVIDLDVTILPPMFTYEKAENIMDATKPHYSITVVNDDSPTMRFVMMASDIHWDKRERGEMLTEMEEFEVEQNMQTWFYNIGYMMHRFRTPTSTFAPYLLEYMHYDGVGANGGTGKSVIVDYLLPKIGYKITKIDAHDPKGNNPQFLMQEVDPDTDLVVFDECYDGFPVKSLNNVITGGIAVEKKQQQKHTRRPEDSPKIVIISNYDPRDFDPSTERRINYMPVSHFFHYKSNNTDFTESRSIADYFGRDMWDPSYPKELLNLDANFLMQCEQFYLHVNVQKEGRIQPPMTEILLRHNEQVAEGPFSEFARGKFIANAAINTNREIPCDEVLNEYNAFRRSKCLKEVTINKLTGELRAWIKTQTGMVYNPLDVCNDKTARRIRHNGTSYYYIRKGVEEAEIPF